MNIITSGISRKINNKPYYNNDKNIKTKSNDATFLHNKEVLKTINTLSFVIGHMESELKTKCIYLEEKDWNSCHYVKNK